MEDTLKEILQEVGTLIKSIKNILKKMIKKKSSDFLIDDMVHSVYKKHFVGDQLIVDNHIGLNAIVEIIKTKDKKTAEALLLEYLEKVYCIRENLIDNYNIHEFERARNYYSLLVLGIRNNR